MLLSSVFHRNCNTVQSYPERKDGDWTVSWKLMCLESWLLFTFKISRGLSNFAYNMIIKLSVEWAGLLAWRHALVLKILIWMFDFGPKKLARETRHRAVRVMFYIFFRSLCSWWDVLTKNNSASQQYFVYLLWLTC